MNALKNRKVRWGIIGLGNIAHNFASDLLTVNDAELYAVASRTQEKADKFAKQFKATKAYSCYTDLVEDSNIDAVYIATPHAFHKENTLLCLNKGIAVLCEKPFAMNSNEVNEMITCAKTNKILLMEALWTYFLPSFKYALDLVNKNKYGKVIKLEADFGFYSKFDNSSRLFNKSLGGGSLLDIGIYPIFSALTLLGIPEHIEAKGTFYKNGVDATCDMIFSYPNNVKAHLKSTLLEPTPTEAIIHCEKAIIKINSQFHTPSSVTISTSNNTETITFENSTFGYNFEIMHFNSLVRQGKTESDIMTFNFSESLIKTLDDVSQIIGLKY